MLPGLLVQVKEEVNCEVLHPDLFVLFGKPKGEAELVHGAKYMTAFGLALEELHTMSNINLRPGREARALRQKKQFGALLGILCWSRSHWDFFANWLVDRQISPSSNAISDWFRKRSR